MGLFENFPYTNFHEINLDQIIKIMRQMQDEWQQVKTDWDSMQDFINNYFDNLDVSEEVLQALQTMAGNGELNTIIDPVIVAETAAWLAEHITPTSPAVDNTLSIAGAAADAKATGNAVADLKEDLSDLVVYGEYETLNFANLFSDPTFVKGEWGAQNGTLEYSSFGSSPSEKCKFTRVDTSAGGYLIAILPVNKFVNGRTYRISIRLVSEYDSSQIVAIRQNTDGVIGHTMGWIVTDERMTEEYHRDNDTLFYYEWTVNSADFSTYPYIQIQFKITNAPRSYVEPFIGLSTGDTEYAHIYKLPTSDEKLEPVNLFDGNYIDGHYYNIGPIIQTSGYNCTEPQYLEKGDYLCIINTQYFGSSALNKVFTLEDDSTNATASVPVTLLEERVILGIRHGLYTFTIANDGYIGINIGYGELDPKEFMIVKGSIIAEYPQSYRYYFEPYQVVKEPVKLNNSMTAQVTPIFGKKVSVNGDSICAGAGEIGGFMKPIAGHNNMDCTNIGVSGGTITYGTTYPETGNNRHWICTTIQNMPSDCDYYIFEGGVNDYANNVPLGVLTNTYPVKGASDDNIDNTTLIGAMEYACRDLVTMFAGKKCGFVFPHGIFPLTGGYATWHTQYKPGMIAALEKWGVPYIDLENEVPPLNLIPSLKAVYTADGDGWHPNKEGYEAFYTDKIKSWMETL